MKKIADNISKIAPRICIFGIITNLIYQIFLNESLIGLMPSVLIIFFLNSLYVLFQNPGHRKRQHLYFDFLLCTTGVILSIIYFLKQVFSLF